MRRTVIETLGRLARQDPRVVLLTGDLGFTVVEPFAEEFPDRFFNTGVAEQNMVGMATGLAEAGMIPFVYSIVTFASLRPYEFIRNGPVAQQLPVRILGIGGGFDYGTAGLTHFGLEDLGVMRMQPGITVVAPADHEQARGALEAVWDIERPIYFRIGKEEGRTVPGLDGAFGLGRAEVVRRGGDLLILAIGSMALNAVAAADRLALVGAECTVVVVSSFNPSPVEDLVDELSRFPLAMTVEAHYATGGLGSLVAEVIADNALACRLVRCGVERMPAGAVGTAHYMNHLHGLSVEGLVSTAQASLEARSLSGT